LTTYSLAFLEDAKKEWDRLGNTVRAQFKKKLSERLIDPHVPSAKLRAMPGCYKIKLRAAGYRLVYQVDDTVVIIVVVAVGKRDRNLVYNAAVGRI
jgi:mRNA interferase RelE/StbE